MAINKNIALVCVAVVMTLAMWMVPEIISAETHKQRLLLTSYNTNSNRTQAVTTFCAGVSRNDLISDDQKSTAESYKSQLASQLKINGNTFINAIVTNGTSSGMSEVKSSQTAFGIFIGFFVVGFVILIIQWMCLCCCCCCPSCCPSKCCQKDENEQYTKCELYWPSIALITLLLLIIIVSAIGLAKASTFKKGVTDLQCSTAILFDDIVNGNVTLDGNSFFIGITNLVSTINDLNSNISEINGNLTNLNTSLGTITSDMSTAQTDIQMVPNNAAADGNAVINYKTNIGDATASATGTYSSEFIPILGSSGNGGIIGAFYTTMSSAYSTLNGFLSSTSGFTSGASGLSSSMSGITSDLNNVKTQITDINGKVKSGLDLMQTPKTIGTLVINLIYGIALGLAALALLGVILMTFCDKYKCRYLMYFSCVILFFIGLIGFLIAIIFSIIVPVLYLFCQWMDVTITSSGFTTNTGSIINDSQVQNILSACLDGGSGDIMSAVGGASIGNTMNNLTNAISQTNTYNTSELSNNITTAQSNITGSLTAYKDSVILDVLNNSDAVTTLRNIANTNCQTVDSYPPSMTNTSTIGCSISGGATVKPSTAGTCTQADFESASPTSACQGCIDTTLIMNKWYVGQSAGTWATKLNTKYPAGTYPSCTSWITTFGNVWDNYYSIKIQAFSDIDNRMNTANTSLGTVITDLNNLNTQINNVKTNLINTFQPILDPKYGLIAGLNCKIIGEDLKLMISSICVSNFNTLYITRLLMGIAAFGIMAAMWCIVCSGVRHFKHSERKDRVSPNFFGDKASFENTDAAFRP